MANLAMIFGLLLGGLGGGLYAASDFTAATSLIPAYFGIGLVVCGILAKVDSFRMHAMHVAALIGLVGCVMPLVMVVRALASGADFRPLAHGGQLAMAGLCGVFLVLCIKSFIDARRARKAGEAAGPQT